MTETQKQRDEEHENYLMLMFRDGVDYKTKEKFLHEKVLPFIEMDGAMDILKGVSIGKWDEGLEWVQWMKKNCTII
jgi:hypothetical protein